MDKPMHAESDSEDFEIDAEAALSDEEDKSKKKVAKYNKYAKKGAKPADTTSKTRGKELS